MLTSDEPPLILGSLSVVTNLAVFTTNQNTLREAGLISVLPKLILHSSRQIKQKTCEVVANMAINEKNNAGIYLVNFGLGKIITFTFLRHACHYNQFGISGSSYTFK